MDTTYNVYSIILLVGIVQCVVVAAALTVGARRDRHRADGWLAAVLVAVALFNAPYLFGFMGLYNHVAWLSNFPVDNAFLIGPVTLGYVAAVTGQARRRYHMLALFAPAAVAVAVDLWVWSRTFGAGIPYGETVGPVVIPVLDTLGLVFNSTCAGAAAVAVVRYRKRTAESLRVADRLARRWLPRFLSAVVLGLTAESAFSAAYALGVAFSYTGQWWAHAAYTVLGYYMATAGFGFAQRLDVAEAEPDVSEDRATLPPMEPDDVALWRPQLDAWMRAQRPHLRSDLTLGMLATEVGLAPAALSHVVNAGFGRNFNDFVNGYRVAEVQARLREPGADRLTLLGVALECGFNSKATFNRAFRRTTGTTPSAWWNADRTAQTGRTSGSETAQTAI